MNITCSVLNIGPVTFQWKLCVVRYSVKVSASRPFRPLAMASRSLPEMPMSIGPTADLDAALVTGLAAVFTGALTAGFLSDFAMVR